MVQLRNILLAAIFLTGPALAGETIDVASFGAAPNDGKDDTAALRVAFAKCRGTKDATLVFADGQYDIKLPDRNHQGLLAEECAGLTIDGRGATLMFNSISSAIVVRNVQGLMVRNLTIDMSRPPFSVGTVAAVGEGAKSFNVTIENNTIRQSDTAAIFVGSTDGFTVRGNTIEHCCDQPKQAVPGAAIRIHNSANGKIEDNKIPPERKGAGQTQDVVLDPGCDASTINREHPN